MRTIAFRLSLILFFVMPWEASIEFPGLGTLSRVTGLLIAAFWGLTVVVTGGFRKPRPFHALVFLFILWNTATALWSVDLDRTLISLQTYFQLALFILILWDLYTTREAVKAGLQAYVLGAYVAVGSLLANYLAGTQASYDRYATTGFNPNTIALTLALGVPVAWYLAASEEDGRKGIVLRFVNYAYIPAALFAISLSATRFALLATLPAFLFGIGTFTRLKPFPRVLIFVLLAAALYFLPSLIPQPSLDRLATIDESIRAGDLGGRVVIWREGLAVFVEHPLFGIGSGAFPSAIESGRSAHNTFLVVLVELGIIGFILFALILAIVIYRAVRLAKWDYRFWLTLLLVWALGSFAMTWTHTKPTWLFLSLVIASANVAEQRVEARQHSRLSFRSMDIPKGGQARST